MSRRLSVAEAADYLNVEPRFMYRLVNERRIAHFKVGRFLRFEQDDLDAYLQAGRVEAVQR